MSNSSNRTLRLTQFAILLAILAIFSFTPLGSIPIGPAIVMTLGMIPVIIAGIVMGTGAGAAMGAFAGLFSLIVMTFFPASPLTAFIFSPFYSLGPIQGNGWSLVICFVPRILTGVVASLTYQGLHKKWPDKPVVSYSIAGILGSMTNTLLVMGGVYVFFGQKYAEAIGAPYSALLGLIGLTIATNGVVEAVVSAVSAFFVCRALHKALRRSGQGPA